MTPLMSRLSSGNWRPKRRPWKLYRRAVERANKAVEASSLGQKVKQLEKKLAAIEEALVNTRAYREWRGPDKFTALCHVCEGPENESIGSYAEYTDRMHRYFDARRSFRVDEVLEEYEAEHSRMNALQSRMVLKFLADEIARAVEQELGNLERELRELEKKARKGVTISELLTWCNFKWRKEPGAGRRIVTAQVPPLSYGTSQFLLRQRPHAAGVPTLLSARG